MSEPQRVRRLAEQQVAPAEMRRFMAKVTEQQDTQIAVLKQIAYLLGVIADKE